MILSIHSRIILGLVLGIAANSYINAQNQTSDEALIALAKQKEGKINPEDYVKFYANFLNSTKDIYIKYQTQRYEDSKETFKISHNEMFDEAQKNPKEAKDLLGDPKITREAWQIKFEKEWNPKKRAEKEWQEQKDSLQENKNSLIELIKKDGLAEVIKFDLRLYHPKNPRRSILIQTLKQWLDKY